MSKEDPQCGAARIHGELLMLAFEVAQSTVSKYMVRGGDPTFTKKVTTFGVCSRAPSLMNSYAGFLADLPPALHFGRQQRLEFIR